MRRHKRIHRIVASLLALVLVITMIPDTLLAQAPENTADVEHTAAAESTDVIEGKDEVETANETEVSEQFSLYGSVMITNADGTTANLDQIKVLAYRAADYDKTISTNKVIAETVTKEDGMYRLDNLAKDTYRLEFVSENAEFDPTAYTALELDQTVGYQPIMAETEKAQDMAADPEAVYPGKTYFACVPQIVLEVTQKEAALLLQKVETAEDAEKTEAKTEAKTEPETETKPEEETKAEAEIEPEAETKPESEAETKPEFSDLMTIEELKELDEETAGATMELADMNLFSRASRFASGTNWTFDTYYVKEDDLHDVKKTDDFNLKYQMEFHASQDLDIGAVEIRIPRELLQYRDKTSIVPKDIAVPEGTMESVTESRSTPFNYFVDEETGELVFFNYREIKSGTNAAFQVLYKYLKIMEIRDETTWSLQPKVAVTVDGEKEEREVEPLTGKVDSGVTLSSVKKTPLKDQRFQYTPELYTKKQVERYITGELPQEYEDHFDQYNYMVWQVDIVGRATQPWTLSVNEAPGQSGKIVGCWGQIIYKNMYTSLDHTGQLPVGADFQVEDVRKYKSWSCKMNIVAAYPKDQVYGGQTVSNSITVGLRPDDGVDETQRKPSSATWVYRKYDWIYRGDTIGIQKWNPEPFRSIKTYTSWLDVYEAAREQGEDVTGFPFTSQSSCRGYGFTHTTAGEKTGAYIPGTSYTVTTVDDALYAYTGDGNADTDRRLSGEDYYFSEVTVEQEDRGYDIYEDAITTPEKADGKDQGVEIYAMYADTCPSGDDAEKWELVETIPWNASGNLAYTFTDEQLARQPWRIKAVHNTINYQTACTIRVNVCIRHDSPIMEELLASDSSVVSFENNAGVLGESFGSTGESNGYFHETDMGDEGNYKREELKKFTNTMYQILIQRSNAVARGTRLTKKAKAFKTSETINDSSNSRALVNYCLTAYDGYELYAQEAVGYLLEHGVASPGRSDVVFYDLLPYGVRFNPSGKVTAGRIKSLDPEMGFTIRPKSWDKSQVEVTVDSEKDIIENYRGTGRTRIAFHIQYSGADAAVYDREQWFEGWGVSFQAYYDWKDMEVSQSGANISAFMPEAEDLRPLVGKDTEVARDDGVIVPSGFETDYAAFGSDINGDNITDIRNVLYARNVALEDIALASESKIEKLVRADEDRFGTYKKSAEVSQGNGYTYDITVSNASSRPSKNIVIYDRLENAGEDRAEVEGEIAFEDNSWYGTFQSVVTAGLEEKGIKPTIYYNADRTAVVTDGTQVPGDILTEAHGWYTKEQWESSGKETSHVRAVAVDISKKTDGTLYELEAMSSVTFQIKMQAPSTSQDATYAYNNPAFYSSTDTDIRQTVAGDSVKVKLANTKTLEVEKQFKEEVPESVADTEFDFYLTQTVNEEQEPYANKEYQLWTKVDDKWTTDSVIYATNVKGRLTLKNGQKAVFPNITGADDITVQEQENPFWDVSIKDSSSADNALRSVIVENTYRPVLYAQKKVELYPDGMDVHNKEFTFQILSGGEPLANSEYWYVDSARTDGGIPSKVTEKGTNGVGTTDEKGCFTIRPGEIIALFPGAVGSSYTLNEIPPFETTQTDWICKSDTVHGILTVSGASASITNTYRWKSLYLTKTITHQDLADCVQEFTFQVTDGIGKPLNGNRWVVMDGNNETEVEGRLDLNGKFTAACGGKVVKIQGLDAKTKYCIQETDSGSYYQPLNGGIIEIETPVYSTKVEASITNDYLKRPLSITKIVTYDKTDLEETAVVAAKEFTMTVKVNDQPLADASYYITENGTVASTGATGADGSFSIKNGQTVTFKAAGVAADTFEVTETQDTTYPQIYPAEQQPQTGTITSEGAEVTFVNGAPGGLLLSKEYTAGDYRGADFIRSVKGIVGEDVTWPNYLQEFLAEDYQVLLTLTTTDAEGKSTLWPQTTQTVTVINQLTGGVKDMTWTAGRPITIDPWTTVQLSSSQMENVVSYSLEEAAENQHRQVFGKYTKRWFQINQKIPENDQAFTGTLEGNPVAAIVNEVTGMLGSYIEKRMTLDSESPDNGAQLVWRVERYDGAAWKAAEGVPYIPYDKKGPTCNQVLETGANGEIILVYGADPDYGYPAVQFKKDKVKLNVYAGAQKGDLRVIELLEKSDASWGTLVGYGNAKSYMNYSMDMSSQEAVAFVNSNQSVPVEIEKKMTESSDATFTMVLKQVVAASADPITKAEEILEMRAGAGIAYQLYESATGHLITADEPYVTGSGGEIVLKAGQYARLNLPDQTKWTVSEQGKAAYTLKDLTGTQAGMTKKLGTNLILINPKSPTVLINKEMVRQGVIDASTGKKVILNQGDVTIPEKIVWENQICTVIGIDDYAFEGERGTANPLTGIHLPETILEIGVGAFYECADLKGNLVIPDSVRKIDEDAFVRCGFEGGTLTLGTGLKEAGRGAFSGCKFGGKLIIPNGMRKIERELFAVCNNLIEVEIGSGVDFIDKRAFYYCAALTDVTIPGNVKLVWEEVLANCENLKTVTLEEGVETIGWALFMGCDNLYSVYIPSSVTSINDEAFRGSYSLEKIYVDMQKDAIPGAPWGAELVHEKDVIWKQE